MDYHGTSGNDILSQAQLALPDWSLIYGGPGDDTITIGVGSANGEAGNDTLIGTTRVSTVVFWSPAGVVVNLATGIAQDGYGTTDRLVNIHTVHGTGYDDQFIGSSGDDSFWGLGGNDRFVGGGGTDTVVYWNTRLSEVAVSYDSGTDTFTVRKSTSAGDKGTDTLTGIYSLSFGTPDGYSASYTKYDLIGDFPRTDLYPVSLTPGAFVSTVRVGDFNGDGQSDLVIAQQVGAGTAAVPIQFYGGGEGYSEITREVLAEGSVLVNAGGGRTLTADFNNDGVTDIFQLGFGLDAPPFPGGTNQLILSSPQSRQLEDVSNTLQQTAQQNHGGCVGDVNGDGYLDVLVNSSNGGNFLQVNDGTGHFIDRSEWLPHWTMPNSSLALTNTYSGIVDVNNDGWVDIILGRWSGFSSTRTSLVLLNSGGGDFKSAIPIELPSSGVFAEIVLEVQPIDLNGDELPDLLVDITSGNDGSIEPGSAGDLSYRTPYLQLLVNDGNGRFHDETAVRLPQPLSGSSSWYQGLVVADFDNDGHSDILATSSSSSETIPSVVFMNSGNGTFREVWESIANGKSVAIDDDEDGLLDVATVYGNGIQINHNALSNGHVYRSNFGGESLVGSAGADSFESRSGSSRFDGGDSVDIARYRGLSLEYSVVATGLNTFQVASRVDNSLAHVRDTLVHVERLQFSDISVALDLSGNAGTVAKILGAVFGKAEVANEVYAGIGLHYVDGGMTYLDLMQLAVDARLGAGASNQAVVDLLYANVAGAPPSEADRAAFVGLLDSHQLTVASLGVLAADHQFNLANIDMVGLAARGLEYLPFPEG